MMFTIDNNSYFFNQIPNVKEPIAKHEDIILYGKFRNGVTDYMVYEANNRVRYAKIFKNNKGEYFLYNNKRYRPEMFEGVKSNEN